MQQHPYRVPVSRPWRKSGPTSRKPNLGRFVRSASLLVGSLLAINAGAVNLVVNSDFEAGFAPWVVTSEVTWNTFVEDQSPNHSGNRVFKTFGHWDSAENQTSMHQDFSSSPGNTYTAEGWIFSRSSDHTGGDNTAYYEVWFRNSGGTLLAKYRSDRYTSSSAGDTWFLYSVTNQIDLATDTITNTVSSLVAPAGTASVRIRVVHHSKNYGGGAEHFDDVVLNQTSGNLPPAIANVLPTGLSMFSPASAGITFNATSATTNIDPSGIHVVLNGLDVSGSLIITGPGNNRSVTYPNLNSNRLYTAAIQVVDQAGYSKSATVSFDTFLASNFSWESVDYDFNGGSYINAPVLTSTNFANSYFGQVGTAEIDFHEAAGWGGNASQAYRAADNPGPGTEYCGDFVRQKYVDAISGGDTNVHDFDLGWMYNGLTGDWVNYTRNIPGGVYNLYGRVSGGGGTSKVQVGQVVSGAGTVNQATNIWGLMTYESRGWQIYDWVPLKDASGNLITLNLTNVYTVRISSDNANLHFFMLAPARTDLPLIANIYPSGLHPFEPTNTLAFTASSTVATIPTGNIHVTLNGNDVTPLLTIGGTSSSRTVSLPYLGLNSIYSATISVTDSAGTTSTRSISFDTFSESNYSFEAEDFDFGGGQFIANPVLSTSPGPNNYYQQGIAAVDNVDLLPSNISGQQYAYRLDSAGTEATLDYSRKTYVTAQVSDAGVKDYNIGWWVGGQWFNYTRPYPAGNYQVYARAAGPAAFNFTLQRVSGGSTNTLGSFLGNSSGYQAWTWVPLTSGGNLATFTGGTTQTLRVTSGIGNANGQFYMLAPAKTPVVLKASTVGGQHVVSIPTQAGATYTLYYKNTLGDANWTYLTIIAGDGTTKSYTDLSATGSQRYYRAAIQ